MKTLPPSGQLASVLFPDLDLGDARRDRRFSQVVDILATGSGESLPDLFPRDADYNALLRLFDAPTVTHERIFEAHQTAVLNQLESVTTPVLLIHDSTQIDYSGHSTLEADNGPIGNGGGRGWISHQSLAVDPATRHTYGLVSQILHSRPASTKGESIAKRRDRKDRETRLWIDALDEIGPAPAHADWIDVMDRGADAFEILWELVDRQRQFIVRSTHNRALGDGPTDVMAEQKLHDTVRKLPATASWTLNIAGRKGVKARTAQLHAVAMDVELRPPHVQRGNHPRESVSLTIVRVWEVGAPDGTTPLEWLLLTNRPTSTVEEMSQIADWYACRWQIEEYHKAQKTGAMIENCQCQTGKKVKAYIALQSVVAVMLMNLRLAARDPIQGLQPAATVVPAAWITILDRLKVRRRPLETVRDFYWHLAWLGGFMKDKPDRDPPGWHTLWRGWLKFQTILHYELSRPKM